MSNYFVEQAFLWSKLGKILTNITEAFEMGPENSEPVESTESTETSELTNYLEKLKIFASLLPSTLDHVSDIAGRYKVP